MKWLLLFLVLALALLPAQTFAQVLASEDFREIKIVHWKDGDSDTLGVYWVNFQLGYADETHVLNPLVKDTLQFFNGLPNVAFDIYDMVSHHRWLKRDQNGRIIGYQDPETCEKLDRNIRVARNYTAGHWLNPGQIDKRGQVENDAAAVMVVVRRVIPPFVPTTAQLTFMAYDEENFPTPLDSARVAIYSTKAEQINRGGGELSPYDFRFRGEYDLPVSLDLKAGNYVLKTSRRGFETDTRIIKVKAGEDEEVPLLLKKSPPPPPPTQVVSDEVDYYAFVIGTNEGMVGFGGMIRFSKRVIIGATFSGRDWNDTRENGLDGFIGYQLPKLPVSLIAGLRRESQLDNFWDAWGFIFGAQVNPQIGPVIIFAQGGLKQMRVNQHEVLGSMDFFNDPSNPNIIRVEQPVIQPKRNFWETNPFIRAGIGIQLDKNKRRK